VTAESTVGSHDTTLIPGKLCSLAGSTCGHPEKSSVTVSPASGTPKKSFTTTV
jgi:hypothetical protein